MSFRVCEHVNGGGVSCTWVCSNTSNDGGKGYDGEKQRVSGRVYSDVFMSFVVLLKDEGDGDYICCVEFWVVVREFVTMLEEMEIMESKCFCSAFFTC